MVGGEWALRLLLIMSALLFAGLACGGDGSDEQTVTYENATAGVVRVAIDGVEVATIQPDGTAEVRVTKELMPDHIEAFDTTGSVLVDQTVTWDDLEAGDWRVVIE